MPAAVGIGGAVYVRVDLSGEPASVSLEEPDDCRRFEVLVEGGSEPARVDEALSSWAVGRLEDREDAFIQVAAVRRLAAGRVPEGWDKDFLAMVEHARTKGWFDPYDDAIEVHCRWPGD